MLVVENDGERRLADVIANDPQTELAAVAATGRQAIALTRRVRPDAIVMASNVLGVNAFDATREIMSVEPTPIVVVFDEVGASAERARTRSQEAGAVAAVPYPAQTSELTALVLTLASVQLVRRRPARPLREAHARRRSMRVVAIGASTGGPAALRTIFAALPGDLDVPILVTQHITSGFSDGMVTGWNAAGPLRAKIAEEGERLCNGTIYVAPDEHHLAVSAGSTVALSNAPPVDGLRPSASVMFRSAAECFGAGTLAVILTGMGRDGVGGLAEVRRAGGIVYAQDEPTSAVFGMPKAAIDAGLVDFILPLSAIARHITEAVSSE